MLDIKVVEQTDEIRESLVKAKVYLGLATTLFSYMLYRTNIDFCLDDPKVKTAAATVTKNGNFIFIDVSFWNTLNDKQRAFLLLHELNHIFLEHPQRVRDNAYNNKKFNIASDYYINLMATGAYQKKDGKIGYNERYKKYLEFIEGGLYDEKWLGMSSDEIYHKLDDSDMSGFDDSDMDIIEAEDETHQQEVENRQTAIEAVINAQSSQTVGENEQGIVKHFGELLKPKIEWTEHLQNLMVKYGKEYTTYKRYNNKSNTVIFPSYEGFGINVVFGIDTSGSMSNLDITRALSELKGLLESYNSWKVTLITADVKAHLIGVYSSDNGDGFDNIDFEKLLGGGGTLMDSMVEYAIDVNNQDPINACIILTDGYLADGDLRGYTDFGVICVITDKGNKNYINNNVEVIYA